MERERSTTTTTSLPAWLSTSSGPASAPTTSSSSAQRRAMGGPGRWPRFHRKRPNGTRSTSACGREKLIRGETGLSRRGSPLYATYPGRAVKGGAGQGWRRASGPRDKLPVDGVGDFQSAPWMKLQVILGRKPQDRPAELIGSRMRRTQGSRRRSVGRCPGRTPQRSLGQLEHLPGGQTPLTARQRPGSEVPCGTEGGRASFRAIDSDEELACPTSRPDDASFPPRDSFLLPPGRASRPARGRHRLRPAAVPRQTSLPAFLRGKPRRLRGRLEGRPFQGPGRRTLLPSTHPRMGLATVRCRPATARTPETPPTSRRASQVARGRHLPRIDSTPIG